MSNGIVYILEFSEPLGNPDKARGQAKFYIGWCEAGNLSKRLAEHRAGRGAAITRACVQRGIDLDLVMTIPKATRADERRLKRQKNTPRIVALYRRGKR